MLRNTGAFGGVRYPGKNITKVHGSTLCLIHEFSITGSMARQPLLMADQACNCWFFFISNTFNGLIFNMEYDI